MKRRVSKVTLLLTCGVSAASHSGEESIRLMDGAGRDSTAAHCAICHSLDYIGMNAPVMNRAAWEKTVQKMIARFGAPIDEAAARDILDYLSAHYSESKPAP
jgi:cytochrome c5